MEKNCLSERSQNSSDDQIATAKKPVEYKCFCSSRQKIITFILIISNFVCEQLNIAGRLPENSWDRRQWPTMNWNN